MTMGNFDLASMTSSDFERHKGPANERLSASMARSMKETKDMVVERRRNDNLCIFDQTTVRFGDL